MYDPIEYQEAFEEAITKVAAETGPIYYLWVFDPQEDKVILEHNEGRHPAQHIDHSHLEDLVPHPDRVHGYAYRIRGGYRVLDARHRAVEDPHVRRLVFNALTR
jgi:hypothetical protein